MTRALLLATALAAAAALPAKAQLGTGTSCSVSAVPMQFAPYAPFSGLPAESATTVTVTCSGLVNLLVSYEIRLGPGGSGSIAARTLGEEGGDDALSYQIYSNSSRTMVWGDGVQGSAISGSLFLQLVATSRVHTVYGRIPESQLVNAGDYSDELVMTVIY